ncbi:MAG: site-2 protease family protein [Defluviicoccus sp.]|nr:site-2 protease family protein [Defluviicoccus sp.]MDE0277581.1 site-2 protease family protein [Defluviicoccus sp.]
MDFVYTASTWIAPVLIAITLHEAAHGYVAWRLGDDTAKRLGRVTFNPLRHVDPYGTIVIPALLLSFSNFVFGWAKPVPVDFSRLERPRRDMVWVAAAGPAVNIALAAASAALMHLVPLLPVTAELWVFENLRNSIVINLVLAVFNLLPLPPLDGGRIAVGLLPLPLARPLARMERFGLFVIIGVLFVLPYAGQEFGVDLNVFPWLIGEPVRFLMGVIAGLAGFAP